MKRPPPARVLNTAARAAATIVATMLRDRLINLGADPGSLPSELSARCLRASLATALLLVNVDPDVIRHIDRWRADEMLQHLLGAIGRMRNKASLRKIVKVWTEWDGDEVSAGNDDHGALGKNDSCDATDCVLSDGSVLTGDTSRKHWWRVAVDPPGWTPQNTAPLQAATVEVQRSSNNGEEVSKSTRHSSSLASKSLASKSVLSESVPFGSSVFRGSPSRGHRCGADDTSSFWAADSDTSSIDYHIGDTTLVWPGSDKNERSPRHTMMKKKNESASNTVEILKVLSERCGGESSSTTSTSTSTSDGSMPPPGFTLPLKEFRDTENFVRKTLSKSALDPDIEFMDDNRVNFAKFSVDASTNHGEILSNHSSPLNGLQFVYSVCGSGLSKQIVEPVHRENSKRSGGGYSSSTTSKSSSSDGSDGSMPPPGFTLPRKEIRDTIKYHHKLGKILSKLALDPDMKSMDDIGVNCATFPVDASTNHDYTNHRELLSDDSSAPNGLQFVDSVCGSGALKRIVEPVHTCSFEMRKEFSNGVAQWVSNFENVVNHDVELERVPSMGSAFSSSNYSSKTSRSKKLEQHLSFLESHMIFQFSSSAANWPAGSPTNDCQGDWTSSITDCNNTSISNMSSNVSFFPILGDLRSPPMRTPSPVGQDAADAVLSLGSPTACNSALPPLYSASPPITPIEIGFIGRLESIKISASRQEVESIDDDSDDAEFIRQQGLDNACHELVEDIRRIKDETASMMKEIKNEIRNDIGETMDKQMQQHRARLKLEVSELSERLENATQATIKAMQTHQTDTENENPQSSLRTKASSPFPWKQLQSPTSLRHSTDSSTFFSKAPITPAIENVINSEVLLKELHNSFVSMEARIFDKLTAHMDTDAIRQQHALEEIIEEKVSKVIAGSNLEMKLAVQAVKAETERVSKMALRDRTPPTDRTPPRICLSKNQTGSISPIRQAPFPRNIRSSKSIGADKSWIREISSSVIKDAEEGPQKSLEDSFTETMNVIDEFVADCDDLVSDFDKIASRMQDGNVSFDSDLDPEM